MFKKGLVFGGKFALCAVMLTACGASDGSRGELSPDAEGSEAAPTVERDLQLGMQGEDVRALNSYLTRFGYYPNADLAQRYPAWHPLTTATPAEPDVYDDNTVAAVRALQARSDLPATGSVGKDTRDLLARSRCGVPDGIARVDPSDKFSFLYNGFFPPGSTVVWRMQTPPAHPMVTGIRGTRVPDPTANNPSEAVFRAVIRGAFASWAAQTQLKFVEATTSTAFANIPISFGPIAPAWGSTLGPGDGSALTLSDSITWDPAFLGAVAAHEIGHALGLGHSSITNALMYPHVDPRADGQYNFQNEDDNVSISALSDGWEQLPGTAREVAAGLDGSVWKIGTDQSIAKWNGSSWVTDVGSGSHIAVGSDGIPWVLSASGPIWRRAHTTIDGHDNFVRVPGAATDIAIGSDNSVWVLGYPSVDSAGNHWIYKLEANGNWHRVVGAAGVSLGAGPDLYRTGAVSVPWVVDAFQAIYRQNGGTTWTKLPGLAHDIAVSGAGFAWTVGTIPLGAPGNFALHVFDDQPQLDGAPGSVSPFSYGWLQTSSGAGLKISVGPNSRVYVVNAAGQIFRQTPG